MHNLCNASFFFHSCGNFSFSGASASTNFLHLDSHHLIKLMYMQVHICQACKSVAFKKFQEIPLCITVWEALGISRKYRDSERGYTRIVPRHCVLSPEKNRRKLLLFGHFGLKNLLDLISYHPRFSTQEWEDFQID